jgi:hypothetical protein
MHSDAASQGGGWWQGFVWLRGFCVRLEELDEVAYSVHRREFLREVRPPPRTVVSVAAELAPSTL